MYRNKTLTKAILRSQRCQRNWDLSYEIPDEDIKVIEAAVTACPSKQNVTFYKPYFITDRNTIEKIHNATMGAYALNKETGEGQYVTNSQVLANLLVALVQDKKPEDANRNTQNRTINEIPLSPEDIIMEKSMYAQKEFTTMDELTQGGIKDYNRDVNVAVGIAAGYMNLSASLMGYSTGCCQCYDMDVVKDILGVENEVLLLMGIGMKDTTRPRREHHLNPSLMFKTNNKTIEVSTI
jgi:nitroreductase